jgi:hypothetical protein
MKSAHFEDKRRVKRWWERNWDRIYAVLLYLLVAAMLVQCAYEESRHPW